MTCPSHAVKRAYQKYRRRQQRIMATGPHLGPDGYTLIIPSQWYNATTATFWQQHGFRWNERAETWERDTRLPLKDGKRYTTEVWLTSTRHQFYRLQNKTTGGLK